MPPKRRFLGKKSKIWTNINKTGINFWKINLMICKQFESVNVFKLVFGTNYQSNPYIGVGRLGAENRIFFLSKKKMQKTGLDVQMYTNRHTLLKWEHCTTSNLALVVLLWYRKEISGPYRNNKGIYPHTYHFTCWDYILKYFSYISKKIGADISCNCLLRRQFAWSVISYLFSFFLKSRIWHFMQF